MKKMRIERTTILAIIIVLLGAVLLVRLYRLQILQGSDYAEKFGLQITRKIPVKNVRGTIYDRSGKVLAGNKLAYMVTFADEQSYASNRERQLFLNGVLYKIMKTIEKYGDSVLNYLQIELDEDGGFVYSAEGFWLDRFRADVFGKADIEDMTEEEKHISATAMIEYLAGEKRYCVFSENEKPYTEAEKEEYGIPEEWTNEELLKLLGIRYALSLHSYQRYLPVTVAENVSEEVVAVLSEHKGDWKGVEIGEGVIRVYEGGEACASVVGYTGKISAEELEEKEDDRYSMDSVVGKSGMEQYLEEYLQGRDGEKEILVDNMGRTVSEVSVTDAVSGQDVYLSIDMDLQLAVYEALEKEISCVLLENIIQAKSFDKTLTEDTTDIRIPVYDVYCALFTNGILDLEHMKEAEASEVEKEIYLRFLRREEEIREGMKAALTGADGQNYANLEEQKEYEKFFIQNTELVAEEYAEEAVSAYEKWENGQFTLKEYLREILVQEWLNPKMLGEKEAYFTQKEALEHVISSGLEQLKGRRGFERLVYKYMVLDDMISPDELLMLLYEQRILDKEDGDYALWTRGEFSAYELILRKIQKLEITPSDLALDPCSGSAVVTDTKTGKVLACVSYPSYDNNRFANDMDIEYYSKICQNGSLPLYNRATQQLSAPGSTLKPVTIIAGIQEGVIDFQTSVFCDGVFDKVFPPVKCWNHAGHGEVMTTAGALQHSCNDYLCEVAYRLGMMGKEEFSDEQALSYLRKYAELFHLDEKSGIELVESEPHITDQYAIPSAIGQGTNNFSTVQLGRYANTLANEGQCYKLSLVERIGDTEKTPEMESVMGISEEAWENVHTGMEWYAQNTGIFEGFPIPVAGKSGTAQEMETRPDHGLFIGYAPADEPEISVAVRIANGYKSDPAVSCARDIFEAYFHVGTAE